MDALTLERLGAEISDCRPRLVNYARKHWRGSLSDPDIDDVVQETMAGALKTLHTYRGDSKLSSWLIAIFRFKAITQLKRQRKMVPLDSVVPDPESVDEDNTPSVLIDTPVEKYATPQQIARLQAAISTLSDEHRQVVRLFHLEERSIAEVTALLGIPESTVKTRLFYARRRLRAELQSVKTTN